MTIWSSYPNYGSKNRKEGNLERKGERKWKWKGNENNVSCYKTNVWTDFG